MKSRISALVQKNKNQIKGVAGLIIVFVILKSIAYFSPLFLSQQISPLFYSEFEYSVNLGVILIGFFSFGLPSAYAFFVMKNKREDLLPLFHLHFTILAFLLVITTLILPSLLSNNIFGGFIIGAAMADQVLVANILKAKGRNNLSVVVDTGVYIVLGVLVILIISGFIGFTKELWFLSILIAYSIFAVKMHVLKINKINEIRKTSIIELYGFGLLIFITAPLITLLTNSTRVYIEYFNDISDVGFYSFYFRLAAIVLIIYRVLYILLFRKIFMENHDKLDKYFVIILSLLGFFALTFAIVFNAVISNFIVKKSVYNDHHDLLPLILFQVIFWINTAFFEGILIRERQLKQFILVLVIQLAIMLIIMHLTRTYGLLSLRSIVIINTWAIFCLFLGQQFILIRKKIFYKKTIIIHLFFGMIYGFYLTFA